MNVKFSRWLAIVFGALLPLLAIVRNWSLDKQDLWAFFADVSSGAFLLFAAWKVGEKKELASGIWLQRGVWFAVVLFESRIPGHDDQCRSKPEIGEPLIPPEFSAVASGLGFVMVLAGLISSLRSERSS
jgi:hypothetical protein